MSEHSGNDRGPNPRRDAERSSSGGPRGGGFPGKAPRQGGGRPAKSGQDRTGQDRNSQNRENPSRGPWKPRDGGAPSFRKNDGERRGRPEGANSGRPNRDSERFPRRDDARRDDPRTGARPTGETRRDDRRRDDRPSGGERNGGWKPRNSEGPRSGGQERRPFKRDANGYGRPDSSRTDSGRSDSNRSAGPRTGSGRPSSAERGAADRGFAPRGDQPDRGSRDDQRSAPWKSRNNESAAGPREGRPFNRDANGYRRAESVDRRSAAPRTERRDDRAPRADRGPRQERPAEAPTRVFNPRDLRSANRPDRERSPEIDEGVTGAELDRVTRAQLRTLESKNGEWVAKHLVMAGRLIDDDPELSFQHALAASRRGGRLAAVREAVGLTAYAAGHYAEALREFRTYRRISGSNVHLPLMADSERGLGRPDRALDVARSDEANQLDSAGQVELAIVVSGARADLGQKDAALAALEISQLDKNRAFSYSPRLFRAYADALEAVNRSDEATSWRRQADLADQALGADIEPEIIDLDEDDDEADLEADSGVAPKPDQD